MRIFPDSALVRARDTRLLILDVDGVLTDGRIYYLQGGGEAKAFNTQDGAALKMLMTTGVATAIITGRRSDIVERRAKELGITHLFQGAEDKAMAFATLCTQTGLTGQVMAHIGDDIPDLPLFQRVGMCCTVGTAHPEVIARAHYVASAGAGMGAVAEICQLIMTAQSSWSTALERFLR